MEQVEKPGAAFSMWKRSGAFDALIPLLSNISDVELHTIDHLPAPRDKIGSQRRTLRMVALFAAAPHAAVPAMLKSLRFSNADASWIGSVLTAWDAIGDQMKKALIEGEASDAAIRRWAATAGRTRFASVLRLAYARWRAEEAAGTQAPPPARAASLYRRAVRIAFNDPIEIADLAVDGRDLEKAGITGPDVGKTLRWLLELVINDPSLNTRERLLAELKSRPR
jgi:hypothetical protein